MTAPSDLRTPALTEATPGSRSSTDSTQPAGPTPRRLRRWPAEPRSTAGARPRRRSTAGRGATAARARNGDPLPPRRKLHPLAGVVAKALQGRTAEGAQRQGAGGGVAQGDDARPEDEAAVVDPPRSPRRPNVTASRCAVARGARWPPPTPTAWPVRTPARRGWRPPCRRPRPCPRGRSWLAWPEDSAWIPRATACRAGPAIARRAVRTYTASHAASVPSHSMGGQRGRTAAHYRRDPAAEGVGPPRRAPSARRARPPLHRPPPRPRGHQPAGLRRHPPGRPHGSGGPDLTVATADHNVPTADIDQPVADPDLGPAARGAAGQHGRVRHHATTAWATRPGHRPRHRPRAGPHAAGDDDRLRRQPHVDPRRVRRAGVRHRHQRGGARARHADAPPGPPGQDGGHGRRASSRPAATAKDVILAIIGRIGTGGGIGSVIEYRGDAIPALSMEGRMTICNMSIEAGAKAGLVAPDDTTFAYLEGRAHAPKGAAGSRRWTTGARCPPTTAPPSTRRCTSTPPRSRRTCTWGTNPAQVVPLDGAVPSPDDFAEPNERGAPPAPSSTWGSPRAPRCATSGRHRVHRLLHQLPHRGPAGGGRRGRGPAR